MSPARESGSGTGWDFAGADRAEKTDQTSTSQVRRGLSYWLATLAGGEAELLRRWGIDWFYYVGLGSALLLSASIGTFSLSASSAIIWGLPWVAIVAIGAIYFVLILGFERWLVSDPKAGYYAPDGSSVFVKIARWFTNFGVELVRIAPRLLISIVTSLLFAEILLLSVFSDEINEQLKLNQADAERDWNSAVTARANVLAADAMKTLVDAEERKSGVQESFDTSVAKIAEAVKQRDASIAQAASLGADTTCYPYSYRYYDDDGVARLGYSDGCPSEVVAGNDAYDSSVAPFQDLSQTKVTEAKNNIDQEAAVVAARAYRDSGARDEAEEELRDSFPDVLSSPGLLIRVGALQQLITPSAPGCAQPRAVSTAEPGVTTGVEEVPSSESDTSETQSCNSYYSEAAADQAFLWRAWIFLLEIAPVLLKFVRAILPRTGYADVMAARDDHAHAHARVLRSRQRWLVRGEDRRAKTEMRMAVEDALTEAEIHARANARARERYRLRAMFDRFNAANRPDEQSTKADLPDLSDLLTTDGQWYPGPARGSDSRSPRVTTSNDDLFE